MKDMMKGVFKEGIMKNSKAWQTSSLKMRNNLKSTIR